MLPILDSEDEERFWKNVYNKGEDECWPWLMGQDNHGYGNYRIKDKIYKAHRLAYYFTYKIDPNQLQVCHTCDNPPCCNPKHFFLGTLLDNIRDRDRKGRQGDHSNEQNGRVKCSDTLILEIRNEWIINKNKYKNMKEFASQYDLTYSYVNKIINNKNRVL